VRSPDPGDVCQLRLGKSSLLAEIREASAQPHRKRDSHDPWFALSFALMFGKPNSEAGVLEIASGIVLGGIALFILAAFAEPLIKLAMWLAGAGAVLAILTVIVLLCAGELPRLRHWLLGVAMIVAVIAALVETMEGLPNVRRWGNLLATKFVRFLKKWWARYRIVSGHRQPLFVLAHAPYLWAARLRKRSFPWSRVQRRLE